VTIIIHQHSICEKQKSSESVTPVTHLVTHSNPNIFKKTLSEMAPKSGFYGRGSVEVGSEVEGEGRTRRLAIRSEQLVTQPFEGIDTIYDVIAYTARTHGNRNALGWRDVIDIHEEAKEVTKIVNGEQVKETKKWKYFQLGEYKYLTYLQVQATASEIACGLLQLGVTTDDIFNIYALTRSVATLRSLKTR
jgi:long-chain acyl-CoA synthetase